MQRLNEDLSDACKRYRKELEALNAICAFIEIH